MDRDKDSTATSPVSTQVSQRLKLQLHSKVKQRLELVCRQQGYQRKQLAASLGMTGPRLSSLMQDHLDLFSLDSLVDIAHRCGVKIHLRVTRRYSRTRNSLP